MKAGSLLTGARSGGGGVGSDGGLSRALGVTARPRSGGGGVAAYIRSRLRDGLGFGTTGPRSGGGGVA
jgi:hypothetical protein